MGSEIQEEGLTFESSGDIPFLFGRWEGGKVFRHGPGSKSDGCVYVRSSPSYQ